MRLKNLIEVWQGGDTYDLRVKRKSSEDDRVAYAKYEFDVGENNYKVEMKPYMKDFEGRKTLQYPHRVDFNENVWNQADRGDAFKVINTVIKAVEDFLQEYPFVNSLAIFAEAEREPYSKLDSKRGRIYKNIIKKRLPSSKIEEKEDERGNEFFHVKLT